MTISTWSPVARVISNITNTNPGVVTTTQPHGYISGTYVRIDMQPKPSIFGMCQVNNNIYLITVLTPNDFSINADTRGFDRFLSGQAAILNINQGVSAVIAVSANEFAVGQQVYFINVSGMVEVNHVVYKIIAVAPGFITIDANTTAFGMYIGGGSINLLQTPQVIPVGEVSNTLNMATRNTLTPP